MMINSLCFLITEIVEEVLQIVARHSDVECGFHTKRYRQHVASKRSGAETALDIGMASYDSCAGLRGTDFPYSVLAFHGLTPMATCCHRIRD